MAGRTLFEVATGRVPMPGEPVDLPLLWDSRVSRPVADTIDGLCSGSFSDVRQALRYLHKHAVKRKPSQLQAVGAGHSSGIHFELEPITAPIVLSPESFVPTSPSTPKPTPASAPAPKPAPAPARRPVENDEILPPSKPKPKPWWRRLFGR
jgi:hypothetical protein